MEVFWLTSQIPEAGGLTWITLTVLIWFCVKYLPLFIVYVLKGIWHTHHNILCTGSQQATCCVFVSLYSLRSSLWSHQSLITLLCFSVAFSVLPLENWLPLRLILCQVFLVLPSADLASAYVSGAARITFICHPSLVMGLQLFSLFYPCFLLGLVWVLSHLTLYLRLLNDPLSCQSRNQLAACMPPGLCS